MPTFGSISESRLVNVQPVLVLLARLVVAEFDCSVICGVRSREDQDAAFAAGNSQKVWPDSRHNIIPSMSDRRLSEALDLGPYMAGFGVAWPDPAEPSKWIYAKQVGQWYRFSQCVQAKARQIGVPIRWGGDWNLDNRIEDNIFDDLAHFELVENWRDRLGI